MDTEMDGFATGLSNCVTRDGQSAPTADLPMGGRKFTGYGSSSAADARTDVPSVGQIQDQSFTSAISGGSSNAYTLTLTPAITAYANGQRFTVRANHSNTGASTLAVSGLAAKTIQKTNATALVANDIISGDFFEAVFDSAGDVFEIVSRTSPLASLTWAGVQTFSNGIIFAHETLNYYDEGTWTPAFSLGGGSVTYTTQSGTYIRVGSSVLFTGGITVNVATTPTGGVSVTGLPFTIPNNFRNRFTLTPVPLGWGAGLSRSLVGLGQLNATSFEIDELDGAGNISNPGSDIASACTTYFSATYAVA